MKKINMTHVALVDVKYLDRFLDILYCLIVKPVKYNLLLVFEIQRLNLTISASSVDEQVFVNR